MNITNVIVYVEGKSDVLSMEELLKPLIAEKKLRGIEIEFTAIEGGDAKKNVVEKVPMRAVDILCNRNDIIVVAMPDLQPKNRGFDHETDEQLRLGILRKFEEALARKNRSADFNLNERFRAFCFKHNLEALVLAAEDALKKKLGIDNLKTNGKKMFYKEIEWLVEVENQNHGNNTNPKAIVEKLFAKCGQKYTAAIDAPEILGSSDYRKIAERCSQCFKPFVVFLESL